MQLNTDGDETPTVTGSRGIIYKISVTGEGKGCVCRRFINPCSLERGYATIYGLN